MCVLFVRKFNYVSCAHKTSLTSPPFIEVPVIVSNLPLFTIFHLDYEIVTTV